VYLSTLPECGLSAQGLRQGHLEIEETSKAAGYCGACTPVNVYRVKDSGVIYLRTTVLPSAPQCKDVKGTCW